MRLAIVTGGSKGLGLALCQQLSSAGYSVVEYSRTASHPFSVHLDLSSPELVQSTVGTSLRSLDVAGCDELVVINNAGTLSPIGPASQNRPVDILANLSTNFSSAILFLSTVVARFQDLKCRKVIVNVSSGAAAKGYAGWSLYCAAKAGLEGYLRAVVVEQRREPYPFLAVNVDPGVIDTDMQALIRESSEADFPDVSRFIRRKNEGGLSSPDAVASGVLRILARGDLSAGERYDV